MRLRARALGGVAHTVGAGWSSLQRALGGVARALEEGGARGRSLLMVTIASLGCQDLIGLAFEVALALCSLLGLQHALVAPF